MKNRKYVLKIIMVVLLILLAGYNQLNAQNMINALDKRQRNIIPIAAFTAKGDIINLKSALNEGLDAGLTVNEIKEILVQLYAYAGFPRSLNGINAFMTVLAERKENGIEDVEGKNASPLPAHKTSLELGTEVQTYLSGAPVKGDAMDFAPAIDEYLKAHLFGDIFARDNLDYKSREIATIAILSTLEGVESQLNAHIRMGRNAGLTEAQIWDIASVLAYKVGKKEAYVALKVIGNALGGNGKFPVGEPINDLFERGPISTFDYFSGTVSVQSLVPDDKIFNCPTSNVTFQPGARTRWHSHEEGQILLVTAGRGYYQEKDKPVRKLQKGDVVMIQPDIVHWHGAAADSEFSHLSVMPNPKKGTSAWLEPVSDEEYNNI